MSENIYSARLLKVQQFLKKEGLNAYIQPSSDNHQSEYVADRFKFRTWLSGFTGSMGIAIITEKNGYVWTDSRYFLQAETELSGSHWQLKKQKLQASAEHITALAEELMPNARVGCNGDLFSVAEINQIKKAFKKKNIELVTKVDIANIIWNDRPFAPAEKVFIHPEIYAGVSAKEKINNVRQKIATDGATHLIITALDEICWLLNLRGSDVESNPVFYAYVVLDAKTTYLFIDNTKIDAAVNTYLKNIGVEVLPYNSIANYLSELFPVTDVVQIDPTTMAFSLNNTIPVGVEILERTSHISQLKAIKNPTEIANTRNAMIKDGIALSKAFVWLEKTLEHRTVSEYELASMLAQYRSEQAHYYGESFDAIVGYKSNGAIVHYKPDNNASALIANEGVLLIDSGGQYADGTTDITRTICFGTPTSEQKLHYTLVLKGHIALATAVFLQGTRGIQLDMLARAPLWQNGLNYGHGTGHGVGFFLNVHEPPQGFAPAMGARGTTPHELGMITSNEPGFYKEGSYGIRIENLLLCVPHAQNTFGTWYAFETLTIFPIATNLIDTSLMTVQECLWLNNYNTRVYNALSSFLTDDEKSWLQKACMAI